MLNELMTFPRVVGVKQLRKALAKEIVRQVFLATDADPSLVTPLAKLAEEQSVPVEWVNSMKLLGQSCGIAVGAAAAGLLGNDSRFRP